MTQTEGAATGQGVDSQDLNERAVAVIDRVRNKLTGRDFATETLVKKEL